MHFVFPILFLSFITGLSASGGYVVEYTVRAEGGLFIREGPGLRYKKLALIPDGSDITDAGWGLGGDPGPEISAQFKEAGSDWTSVDYNGVRGWVADKYLVVRTFVPSRLDCKAILSALSKRDNAAFLRLVPRPFGFERHVFIFASSDQLLGAEFDRHRLKFNALTVTSEKDGCAFFHQGKPIALLKPTDFRTPKSPAVFWTLRQAPDNYEDLYE